MDLRVWWPQSTAPETHGRAGNEKTLAVLVVALGLLGFYSTSEAVTVFDAILTVDREVPTGVWDNAEGNNTTRAAQLGNFFSCSDRGVSRQQREG